MITFTSKDSGIDLYPYHISRNIVKTACAYRSGFAQRVRHFLDRVNVGFASLCVLLLFSTGCEANKSESTTPIPATPEKTQDVKKHDWQEYLGEIDPNLPYIDPNLPYKEYVPTSLQFGQTIRPSLKRYPAQMCRKSYHYVSKQILARYKTYDDLPSVVHSQNLVTRDNFAKVGDDKACAYKRKPVCTMMDTNIQLYGGVFRRERHVFPMYFARNWYTPPIGRFHPDNPEINKITPLEWIDLDPRENGKIVAQLYRRKDRHTGEIAPFDNNFKITLRDFPERIVLQKADIVMKRKKPLNGQNVKISLTLYRTHQVKYYTNPWKEGEPFVKRGVYDAQHKIVPKYRSYMADNLKVILPDIEIAGFSAPKDIFSFTDIFIYDGILYGIRATGVISQVWDVHYPSDTHAEFSFIAADHEFLCSMRVNASLGEGPNAETEAERQRIMAAELRD